MDRKNASERMIKKKLHFYSKKKPVDNGILTARFYDSIWEALATKWEEYSERTKGKSPVKIPRENCVSLCFEGANET